MLRHSPVEPALRRVLPMMAQEHPELFLAWHRTPWVTLEKPMARARFLVALIGQDAGQATFAGIYEIGSSRPISHQDYCDLPENAVFREMGLVGQGPERPELCLFDLGPRPELAAWRGKLVLDWPPPERSWWRWADRNQVPVRAITEESKFAPPVPPWEEIVLSWSELKMLSPVWKAALCQWRGVYYIYDVARQAGYVGSAYGADNILGRWTAYAASGHGGNQRLRASRPEDLRFSILQRTSPDMDAAEVIQLEGTWKERLHTRAHGLNAN